MKKSVLAITVLSGMLSTAAFAGQPTQEETQFCAHDYRQYCNDDGIRSQLLTLCMRQHGKELSGDCIKALEAAGELTPAEEAEVDATGD